MFGIRVVWTSSNAQTKRIRIDRTLMMFSLKSFNDRNLTVDLGETHMLFRNISDFRLNTEPGAVAT
jgi:hypothetical protein